LEKLKNALTSVAGTVKPFDINFTNISFGPTKKEPRLIWASGEAPPQLIRLKQELEEALNQPSEKREFLLHLTVARFRPEKRSLRLNVAASGNRGVQPQVSMHLTDLNETIAWPETVSEYQLMRSDLHPDGARYTILQSYAV
jgi:2'-5' RNA ligase